LRVLILKVGGLKYAGEYWEKISLRLANAAAKLAGAAEDAF